MRSVRLTSCAARRSVCVPEGMASSDGDSDGSLSWEDFFGTSTDLVPTLLGMYDTLIGRSTQAAGAGAGGGGVRPQGAAPLPAAAPSSLHAPCTVSRPLSISSIASSSSSSSSSGASSCSGSGGGCGGVGSRRLGAATKSSAYLASIESLDDDDDDDSDVGDRRPKGLPPSKGAQGGGGIGGGGGTGSQGSGDSGVCSPCSHISSPCPPPGRPRYCDPSLSYMDRVVMEVVETEGVYVRDLQQIIEGYLERWRSQPHCPLTEKQLGDLFSNIEEIYKFNSGFLRELEQCGLDPVQVARCFVRKNEGFSIYTQYCTNYPRTVSVLTELMRQEATVRLFRERQTALQHTLPLGSYLLKPVQRILKYHLLLQNIVKHYVYEGDGYSDIVNALSTMTGIAHHINNMKRRHEHAVRVQEIQSLLYSWEGEDLTTFGELCAEGAFRMYGAKAMRHAFLFDKMLLITKKKEEGILGYKTHIMCSNLMLIESVPGEPFSFHVIPFDNPKLQYTLQARNLEQKREWTMQLKRVILENYNAVIPSHARQLVMELGQNRTDDEIMADKSTPKRQHSAPEYLEKRKQDKERRKSETGLRYRLRRSRKSDVGLVGESPTSPRRRRASSSSRDRSQSRDGLRSASPAKIKERFGSWRRKSEPGCYSSASGNTDMKDVSPKLSLAPEPESPSIDGDNLSLGDELASVNGQEGFDEGQGPVEEMDSECDVKDTSPNQAASSSTMNHKTSEVPPNKEEEEEEAKTLEEIVSQLLMQNHEFQKILKKQQRRVNMRRFNSSAGATNRKDETSDTENDDDGVYETLSIPSGVSSKVNVGQTYRAHRYAHMRALRNEQKTAAALKRNSINMSVHTKCSEIESDYVTLTYERNEEGKIIGSSCTNGSLPSSQSDYLLNSKSNILRGNSSYFDTLTSVAVKQYQRKTGRNDTEGKEVKNESKSSESGNYDNLQQIWECVKRQQEEIHQLAENEEGYGKEQMLSPALKVLRRAQSFSCQENLQEKQTPPTGFIPAMSEVSLDTLNIPTLPAVWLKQQGDHLATPNKKSGSLPRSFQLSLDGRIVLGDRQCPLSEQDGNKSGFRARISRDGRSCDRPFTIASDKPAEINFEDIEHYIEQSKTCHIRNPFPTNGDTTEEDSLTEYTTTPNTSLNELNVHPDYKIYRPTVSKATLRHVISSVSNKLAGIRGSSETLESNDVEVEKEILQQERRASRLVYALARQYSKTLKQRIKNIMGEDSEECYEQPIRTPSPVQPPSSSHLPIYKQGSSSLGARIAQCSSDYANPLQLFPNINKKPAIRPDSVLSVSSNFTSSSEGEKNTCTVKADPNNVQQEKIIQLREKADTKHSEKVEDLHLSDGSADSYYERSFEAIEFLDSDVFRDSAVFSDHEEVNENLSENFNDMKMTTSRSCSTLSQSYKKNIKIPPPVPAKPDTLKCKFFQTSVPALPPKLITTEKIKPSENSSIKPQQHLIRGLEGIRKSIRDRQNELEQWKVGQSVASREDECDTSSQHSTASTVIEVNLSNNRSRKETINNITDDDVMQQKGWVKHVIGKLQGPTCDD